MSWISWFVSDSNRIVATATFLVAVAAIAQFELSRRTAQRQLRAYVSILGADLIDGSNINPPLPVDRTDQVGVLIGIKNTGQTPARDALHWGNLEVATPDREFAMTAPSPIRRESISYLPSQGINTKGLWLNRPLSDQEKKDIQTGVRCVFLYGRIEYVDVFKKQRWSTYRLHYSNSAWPPYGGKGVMNFCDTGNEAS
ncbi:MAG: hypothetical protein WA649_00335 [Methylovirgula sp.]